LAASGNLCASYVVQKDPTTGETTITKVQGGGLQPGTTTAQSEKNLIKEKILRLILADFKSEISAWLRDHGKGPLDDETLALIMALPECFPQDADILEHINDNTIPYYENETNTSELREKIETNQTNKELLDKVAEQFSSISAVDITTLSEDNIEATRNATCTALVDDINSTIATGLTVLVNSDTLKTANTVFVITGQTFKLDAKYNVTNGGEVNFKLTIKPEGGGSEIKHPSSDWKKVNNNESWVLELNSVQEGLYTLSYKVGTTTTNLDFYVRTAAHDYACHVCGRNLKLMQTDLTNIFPNSTIIGSDPNILTYFNEALKKGGFTTCYRQAHFFSQVYEESGGMNATLEKGSYSVPQMLKTYKDKAVTKDVFFKQSFWNDKIYLEYASVNLYETSADTTITKYEGKDIETFKWNGTSATDTVRLPTSFSQKKPADYKKVNLTETQKTSNREKLFNLVYSNKNGNGDVASGDGYKFRGRGAIQLTGRTTYREVSNKCNSIFATAYNWESNPEVLESDNKAVIYSVAAFFLWKFGDLKNLDTKDVTYVTKKVNGGTNGLSTRTSKFNQYLNGRLNNCKIKK
jgi:predicted chitinase